ncbi:hypothetical protein D3C71_1201580 [compost metagenome]
MRAPAEEIEVGAHVHRRAGAVAAIEQGQIDRGSPAVAGGLGDVVAKQGRLVDVRVLQGLARLLLGILCPGDEGLHRVGRAVAIVETQRVALCPQVSLHLCERGGRRGEQIALGRVIAGHTLAGEVVGAGVADVLFDRRCQRADVDQSGLGHVARGRDRHRWRCRVGTAGQQRQQQRATGNRRCG